MKNKKLWIICTYVYIIVINSSRPLFNYECVSFMHPLLNEMFEEENGEPSKCSSRTFCCISLSRKEKLHFDLDTWTWVKWHLCHFHIGLCCDDLFFMRNVILVNEGLHEFPFPVGDGKRKLLNKEIIENINNSSKQKHGKKVSGSEAYLDPNCSNW